MACGPEAPHIARNIKLRKADIPLIGRPHDGHLAMISRIYALCAKMRVDLHALAAEADQTRAMPWTISIARSS